MALSSVSAVLFVKDLADVAAFYTAALGMNVRSSDEQHRVLECEGFELVVHQIPKSIASPLAYWTMLLDCTRPVRSSVSTGSQ